MINRAGAISLAPAVLLIACSPPPVLVTPAAEVQANSVTIQTWPRGTLVVDSDFEHVGSTNFSLYDVATADVHLFVDADSRGVVQRMYWVQIEAYLENNDHRYDYSQMPHRRTIGTQEYLTDIRQGAAYSLEGINPGSDVAHEIRLLEANGYRMPETMIRSRMVRLDADRRRELLIIYMESRDGVTPGPAEFEASPELWEAEIPRFLDRAAAGIRVRQAID